MANIMDPTPEQQQGWDTWVRERPRAVRETLQQYDLKPWKLYRLKSSGHRVTLYSVDEPEGGAPPTLMVDVMGRFNLLAFDRRVFGVAPSDLEECDLPGDAEPLGAVLGHDEVSDAVDGVAPGEPRMRAIRDAATRSLQERAPKGDA
jgi:hypothetical protein